MNEPICPECRHSLAANDVIYTPKGTDCVLGCNHCLAEHEAGEWLMREKEMAG